jgi:hypothetical protein
MPACTEGGLRRGRATETPLGSPISQARASLRSELSSRNVTNEETLPMADALDLRETATLEEVVISSMYESEAVLDLFV